MKWIDNQYFNLSKFKTQIKHPSPELLDSNPYMVKEIKEMYFLYFYKRLVKHHNYKKQKINKEVLVDPCVGELKDEREKMDQSCDLDASAKYENEEVS